MRIPQGITTFFKEAFLPQGQGSMRLVDGTLRYAGDALGAGMVLTVPGVTPADALLDFGISAGASGIGGQLAAMTARRFGANEGVVNAVRNIGEIGLGMGSNFIERPWQARLRQEQEAEIAKATTDAQKEQVSRRQREQQLAQENAELQKILAETLFPTGGQVLRSAFEMTPSASVLM